MEENKIRENNNQTHSIKIEVSWCFTPNQENRRGNKNRKRKKQKTNSKACDMKKFTRDLMKCKLSVRLRAWLAMAGWWWWWW